MSAGPYFYCLLLVMNITCIEKCSHTPKLGCNGHIQSNKQWEVVLNDVVKMVSKFI